MGLAAAVTAFAFGPIRARLSYRAIALSALGLWTAAYLITFVAPSAAGVGLTVVLFGIGQGAVVPAVMVWVGEGISPHVRGRHFERGLKREC
jgi:MFS family permease